MFSGWVDFDKDETRKHDGFVLNIRHVRLDSGLSGVGPNELMNKISSSFPPFDPLRQIETRGIGRMLAERRHRDDEKSHRSTSAKSCAESCYFGYI